ncbi:RsfA family transcriptional regulator [Virgibacillus pantothenticus]|uniref:RsfA family transcriptional regulator n=1 Tax=Virgibacillus pantothenticus TaxID=1473 RepID=UPI001C22325E|nr:RsfA family transcriptional regulator [Virgibacillus pantothenticus]MBU8565109.1 RsfA family transcriptional regulator [Virgibacillus pantothenticus]MBU8601055.1 RsfA family transcriptional regulator [Virgibacillus pantothenticus]MBU8633182.1 RsfA family transcriptional regulator [Virgibacillus pantothenticus]MBU8643880.1 RsfA family transcriptional regulator [Virgibacillus pantothenticus]MBU8644914.1 RsfA family transcriptional regulator [Virgibacillus pantothenticus]
MSVTRQDAWTKDEDILLAETVLRYIKEGKTQLEAFKEVAHRLSRTAAACGFRWNATIRKQYQKEVLKAKEARKNDNINYSWYVSEPCHHDPLETVISLLEKIKAGNEQITSEHLDDHTEHMKHLEKENEELKNALLRYEKAWKEIGDLWNSVVSEREIKKETCE